jgi:hypothetical protein
LQERAVTFSAEVKFDARASGYVLWQDMTLKNSKILFRDSLFESRSSHNFKAVEAFDFLDMGSAMAFLHEHMVSITEDSKQTIPVIVSVPDILF